MQSLTSAQTLPQRQTGAPSNDLVELEGSACKMGGCQKLRAGNNPQEKISTTDTLF